MQFLRAKCWVLVPDRGRQQVLIIYMWTGIYNSAVCPKRRDATAKILLLSLIQPDNRRCIFPADSPNPRHWTTAENTCFRLIMAIIKNVPIKPTYTCALICGGVET